MEPFHKLTSEPASGTSDVSLSCLDPRERACALRRTLDNTDIISHVYRAFDNYVVTDMKIHDKATENFAFDFGMDSIFNEQHFLFHPFPGRIYVLAGKCAV